MTHYFGIGIGIPQNPQLKAFLNLLGLPEDYWVGKINSVTDEITNPIDTHEEIELEI
jgi:hypothetical protein